jgi:hypothetical protein
MKKIFIILSTALLLCFSCRSLSNANRIDIVNKCAPVIREYGFKDFDFGTIREYTSSWGHPIYEKYWKFRKGDSYIIIFWDAGDSDKEAIFIRSDNYCNESLNNELENVSSHVSTFCTK